MEFCILITEGTVNPRQIGHCSLNIGSLFLPAVGLCELNMRSLVSDNGLTSFINLKQKFVVQKKAYRREYCMPKGTFAHTFYKNIYHSSDHQCTVCDTVCSVTDCNIWPCWRSLVRSAQGLVDSRQDKSRRKWAFCAGILHCPLAKEIEAFVRKVIIALCYQDENIIFMKGISLTSQRAIKTLRYHINLLTSSHSRFCTIWSLGLVRHRLRAPLSLRHSLIKLHSLHPFLAYQTGSR
jgi:hypothetical protein